MYVNADDLRSLSSDLGKAAGAAAVASMAPERSLLDLRSILGAEGEGFCSLDIDSANFDELPQVLVLSKTTRTSADTMLAPHQSAAGLMLIPRSACRSCLMMRITPWPTSSCKAARAQTACVCCLAFDVAIRKTNAIARLHMLLHRRLLLSGRMFLTQRLWSDPQHYVVSWPSAA